MSDQVDDAGAVTDDPRFQAALLLIPRTGAKSFQIRYSDDPEPTVWMAVTEHEYPGGTYWEAGGGMTPLAAILRLLEQHFTNGLCMHCARRTRISTDWKNEKPLSDEICWYVFDPEMVVFRRSCEGDPDWQKVTRNDPCPCGSGKKFKHCHLPLRGGKGPSNV